MQNKGMKKLDKIENGKELQIRLAKIEGQIKGIRKMAEEERGCEELLMQLSAVNSSIHSLSCVILEQHIEHCVDEGITSGDTAGAIKNLRSSVKQFSKFK